MKKEERGKEKEERRQKKKGGRKRKRERSPPPTIRAVCRRVPMILLEIRADAQRNRCEKARE